MDYRQCEWRVGRKVGRTVYAVIGAEPDDRDVLIGCLDSRLLAADAVYAHNLLRAARHGSAKRLTPAEEQEKVARMHLALQAEAEGAEAAARAEQKKP